MEKFSRGNIDRPEDGFVEPNVFSVKGVPLELEPLCDEHKYTKEDICCRSEKSRLDHAI